MISVDALEAEELHHLGMAEELSPAELLDVRWAGASPGSRACNRPGKLCREWENGNVRSASTISRRRKTRYLL